MRLLETAMAMVAAPALGVCLLAGCGGGSDGPKGGAVTGDVDMHCVADDGGAIKTAIGICMSGSGGGGASDAGIGADAVSHEHDDGSAGDDAAADDAGTTEDDGGTGGGDSDYGATHFNAEGDDDDCKYHLKWTSSDVRRNAPVTFNVTLMRLADGMAATDADIGVEAFLSETHPTPSTTIATTESTGGKYQIGPVVFDQAGRWTVRFHYYEMCSDAPEDSPHGHVAFYVDVP